MQPFPQLRTQLYEEAGYLAVPGAHLYTVLHHVPEPRARVLLAGPFASERQNSYLPWVRWARYLAARKIEVLRFDYRGIGESLGSFERATLKDWSEDLQRVADWFAARVPAAPLILHGLEMGAILASQSFQLGVGDALLLWSPPASANQALRSTLLRWVGLEQLLSPGAERRSASDYIKQLELGAAVEVEGYQWSAQLWRDSFDWKLPYGPDDEQGGLSQQRPVKIVRLPKMAAPLVKGGVVGHDEVKDFEWLYSQNIEWIEAQGAACAEIRQ